MDTDAAIPTSRQIYKVALASIVGSVIEQYDFLVTGVIAARAKNDAAPTAALVAREFVFHQRAYETSPDERVSGLAQAVTDDRDSHRVRCGEA